MSQGKAFYFIRGYNIQHLVEVIIRVFVHFIFCFVVLYTHVHMLYQDESKLCMVHSNLPQRYLEREVHDSRTLVDRAGRQDIDIGTDIRRRILFRQPTTHLNQESLL